MLRAIRSSLLLSVLLLASCRGVLPAVSSSGPVDDAVNESWLRRHYTKREEMIPMRDGVRLHTVIYAPKDVSELRPILMRRTPYSCYPYGPDTFPDSIGPDPVYAQDRYIIVMQDVRGCYLSEGEFVDMRPHLREKSSPSDVDESTDTWDTIDWLVRNVPGNNGRVGMQGISYPGFYCAAGMIDAHPALRAVSPQAPIADWWYDDFHHHGAFFLPHSFHFISGFGRPRPAPTLDRPGRGFEYPTPDGYSFYLEHAPTLADLNEHWLKHGVPFWNEIASRSSYDEFWQARTILPHLHRVAPAVLTVGGWYDAEDLYGPLQIYRSVEEKNPGVFNAIVMGPWIHGGWHRTKGDRLGDVFFGGESSAYFVREIEKPFFDDFLCGEGRGQLPEARMFDTGTCAWRSFDAWPPRRAASRTLLLGAEGEISLDPEPASAGARSFVSDPAKPVPYTSDIAISMVKTYMIEDQRFAGRRPDVLVFETAPLERDLTLAGPVIARLTVETTQQDADWIVKLIDVQPDDAEDWPQMREGQRRAGYQMLVRSEVLRGRYRHDPSRPQPFTPGQPDTVTVPLQDVLHTFRAGHKLMIQIQSTWFPLVDRNPQKWVDNLFEAKPEDFTPATHTVHCGGEGGSSIEIGVLEPRSP